MCLCFKDWQKAFDRVDWTQLLEMLRNIGVNWRERQLIRNLYMGQRVKLRLNQEKPDIVKIVRGFRQGCCMSSILFNLLKVKSVAYSSQGSHTGQLDFCNWLADGITTG